MSEVRYAVADRHSIYQRSHTGADADTRHTVQADDIIRVWEFCLGLGLDRKNLVGTWSWTDHTGSDMTRTNGLLERMELPDDDPDQLDLMVWLNWARWGRAGWDTLAQTNRVVKAGGDLRFADHPSLDVYTDHLLMSALNEQATDVVTRGRAKNLATQAKLVVQGRASFPIWCWRILKTGEDVVMPDGAVFHLPVGALVPEEDNIPWGREAYRRSALGESDREVYGWLEANGKLPPGRRVRQEDGSVIAVPATHWDAGLYNDWVSNPINIGLVRHGRFIGYGEHAKFWHHGPAMLLDVEGNLQVNTLGLGVTDSYRWSVATMGRRLSKHLLRVGSTTAATPPPRTSGSIANPRLGSVVLRCASCRGKLSYSASNECFKCGEEHCEQRARVAAYAADEYLLNLLRTKVLARYPTQQATGDDGLRLARLKAAMANAEAALKQTTASGVARVNKRRAANLAAGLPDTYDADMDAVDLDVGMSRDTLNAAREAVAEAEQSTLLHDLKCRAAEDLDTMSLDARQTLLRCTFPVVFVRGKLYMTPSGEPCRTHKLSERVLPVRAVDAQHIVLPRRGMASNPHARLPIPWPDGSRAMTRSEREWFRDLERESARLDRASGLPSHPRLRSDREEVVTAEDRARWNAARTHYKAHGRTDDQVLAAVEAAAGNQSAAARELGMSRRLIYERLHNISLRRGTAPAEALTARRHYQEHGRTDAEVDMALRLHDGNVRPAALALGMNVGVLYKRINGFMRLAAAEDRERWDRARAEFKSNGRTDDEAMAAFEAADGNYAAAAREIGMSVPGIYGRIRRIRERRGLIVTSLAEQLAAKEYAEGGRTDDEVCAAVKQNAGNVSAAARELGMTRSVLERRWAKLNPNPVKTRRRRRAA